MGLAGTALAACLVAAPGAAASGTRPLPHWRRPSGPKLPVGWFGANASGSENAAQLRMLGNYSMSIFGWQAFLDADNYTHEAQDLVGQAQVVKKMYPEQAVAIYLDAELAEPFQTAVAAAMRDPATENFFLRDAAGMITCNVFCRSMPGMSRTDPRCLAGYWNWFNSSAVDYYLQQYVQPIAESPGYDAIFFDGADEWLRQAGNSWKRATNVPKNVSDTDALRVMTNVRVRTAELLAQHGKYPIISEHIGDTSPAQQDYIASKMASVGYFRYFEFFDRQQVYIDVMINASQSNSNQLPIVCRQLIYRGLNMVDSVASFLIGMGNYTYYSASTGWFDKDWTWHPEYDVDYGQPLGPAQQVGQIYKREFEHCTVAVNCTNPKACTGSIAMR